MSTRILAPNFAAIGKRREQLADYCRSSREIMVLGGLDCLATLAGTPVESAQITVNLDSETFAILRPSNWGDLDNHQSNCVGELRQLAADRDDIFTRNINPGMRLSQQVRRFEAGYDIGLLRASSAVWAVGKEKNVRRIFYIAGPDFLRYLARYILPLNIQFEIIP